MKIVLVCLLWAVEALGQCGEEWYGEARAVYRPDEYSSVEDRAPSFEEVSEEYYPVKQHRFLRSSRHSPPAYGYGNSFRDERDEWERYGAAHKSHYDAHKSRRKYDAYGKSSRSDYSSYKGSAGANGYERKKTSRAAKYGGDGGSYGKTTALTYKAVPPKASCAQNLLIGCTPTVTRVPCSASSSYDAYGQSAGVPYYPPPPPAHPMPSHYGVPHPAHGYSSYGPPPPASYYPPSSPSHAAPAHHKDHSASDHHAKPSEDAHGYGPSYKVATPEEIPGFAAPVREDLSESPKVPIISAFPKPADSTGSAPSNSTQPKGTSANGTAAFEMTSPKTSPLPVLTPAPEQKDPDNDEFWVVESNVESSTDVTEGSTAR